MALTVVAEGFVPSPEAEAATEAQRVRRVLIDNLRMATRAALGGLVERDVFSAEDMAHCALAFERLAQCARSMAK